MNEFLRLHGFGVSLLLGVALLLHGVLNGNYATLVFGVVLVVIGVLARPLEELTIGKGVTVKWQRAVLAELERRVPKVLSAHASDHLTISDSVHAEVIKGGGHTDAQAGTAFGFGQAGSAIVRAESPAEFAVRVIDTVIEPLAAAIETSGKPIPNVDPPPLTPNPTPNRADDGGPGRKE